MKQVFIILAILCIGVKGFSQEDSTKKKNHHDWHKWQEMDSSHFHNDFPWPMPGHHWNNHAKPSNLSTNWLIVDLGFANYSDKTNYSGTTAQTFAPGSKEYWFALNNKKSVDVNIWLF